MSGMGSTGFSSFQFIDKGLNVILATRVGHDGEVMLEGVRAGFRGYVV